MFVYVLFTAQCFAAVFGCNEYAFKSKRDHAEIEISPDKRRCRCISNEFLTGRVFIHFDNFTCRMILKTNEALIYLKQAIKSLYVLGTKNVYVHVVHHKFVRLIEFVMNAKKDRTFIKN